VRQEGTALPPFTTNLRSRVVVFDPPYFDLARAIKTRGIVGWGAHDPGVAAITRPESLLKEVRERFGAYPASDWIYGTPWNSGERAREMGQRLTAAVRLRTRVARWLLGERLPDWDLALLTVSEAHSAIEGLWHGVDAAHPLHGCASAQAAGEGVHSVYVAIDALLGELQQAFPDATLVVFSMHGMGANDSDPGSMLLLAEFLYRRAFGAALFNREGVPAPELRGRAAMAPTETWDRWVAAGFPPLPPKVEAPSWRRALGRLQRLGSTGRAGETSVPLRLPIDWMPATRYQPHWHRMPAFALPSFYDGRIRINLQGREAQGCVAHQDYRACCEELAAVLRACVDPVTGVTAVSDVEFGAAGDPRDLGPTESDLIVLWNAAPLGLQHPSVDTIGPVPYRRTGGHTGQQGFAFMQGGPLAAGDLGSRSAYDIVPTLLDLLGESEDPRLTGRSLRQAPGI
jgi:predicted AlkP superfamily phosphohydrolase/phosphomutase